MTKRTIYVSPSYKKTMDGALCDVAELIFQAITIIDGLKCRELDEVQSAAEDVIGMLEDINLIENEEDNTDDMSRARPVVL